jgi:methyl-accepting chemotaxis protein
MSNNGYKRKQYFIKKNFQGKLILGYFLFMVVGCLIFVLALSYLASDSMTVVYSNNDLQIGQTPLMLLKQLIAAHWVVIVIGAAMVVIIATRITHRVAGPMFNLERSLDFMIDGKLDNVIYLRKKDEGKELASKINQFNAELSSNVGIIQKRSTNIQELLSSYAVLNPENRSQEDLESIHASIEKQNQMISEIVNQYKLLDE